MPADVQNEKKSLLQMEILFYLDNVHVLGKSEKLFNHIWQQNSNCTGTEFAVVALCCVALNSIRIQTHSFLKVLLCCRKQLLRWALFSHGTSFQDLWEGLRNHRRKPLHIAIRFQSWMDCGCCSSFLRHGFHPWRAEIRDLINHSSCMPVRHRNVIAVISGVRQS